MLTKKNIINVCYNNYLASQKNYHSDTWKETSSQNINLFKKFSLENPYTNSNIRGLAPLDNYPSIDFLTKESAKILEKFHQNEFFDTYKKIKFNKYKFAASFVVAFRYFIKIKGLINKKSKVLIIGDGLGVLSSMILKYYNCQIFLCDLSESLVYQEYNLRHNFKKFKFNYIASKNDKINSNANINFINADQIHRLKIDLDLAVNTDSFCEMDKYSVNKYFKFVEKNLKVDGNFFYCNKGGLSSHSHKLPGNYPLSNNFVLKDLEVMYPSHRDTFNKYLAVTARKISNKDNKLNKISNFLIKKNLINKFFNDSQEIIYKDDLNNVRKITIKVVNFITKKTINKKISKKIKDLLSKYKFKKNIKKDYNYNNLYDYLMSSSTKALEKNDIKVLEDNFIKILNLENNNIEVTCVVKLAAIYKFYNQNYATKIIEKIPEDSFEKIFLKFVFLEDTNKFNDKSILIKLKKFKSNQLFDELKLLYCALKVNEKKTADQCILRIEKQVSSKIDIIYLLKLLYNSGRISIFKKYLKKFTKLHKITSIELNEIFLSTCFINYNTISNFRKSFSKFKFEDSNKLNQLILKFKSKNIKENLFIKKILSEHNDYYSLGYILKNTIKNLNKQNVKKICNRSLKSRPIVQNINFIGEIYFYNEMYFDCFNTLKKVKDLGKFSIFYDFKRVLSCLGLKNKKIKDMLISYAGKDFFRTIHNGRLAILPFMCTGNNMVQVTEN